MSKKLIEGPALSEPVSSPDDELRAVAPRLGLDMEQLRATWIEAEAVP